MLRYLKHFHEEDITNILNEYDDLVHASLKLNLTHLRQHNEELFNKIKTNVWEESPKWDNCLLQAQKEAIEGNAFLEPQFQVKEYCHVRFVKLPPETHNKGLKATFPNNSHIGLFMQVKGSVVRMTQSKILEYKREYICSKCKETFIFEAHYNKMYIFDTPQYCTNSSSNCKGYLRLKSSQPKPDYCMNYQEIRLQELFSDKNVPESVIVTLDSDLVDSCQPGDCVTICGTIERRWKSLMVGKPLEVVISMRAISVYKEGEKVNFGKDFSEQLLCIRAQWQDTIDSIGLLNARDKIIQSMCPEVRGMDLIKFAIALSLCSSYSERSTRGHSHLLMIGDPGVAKSKLLQTASKIAVHSVHTTGLGCSAAGLTAAAVKEGGEWQLEAGALVLADRGICCIDEFNLMRQSDKASIHEAMEQQSISMAKAGMVCKLSTKCVVIAATNPKNVRASSDEDLVNAINLGIGTPLLSRFDVILIIRDAASLEWDTIIADFVIKNLSKNEGDLDLWDMEKLQSHFACVKNLDPVISEEANAILGAYYKYCRANSYRDPSRTTVRLLDSLNRLAKAHARLTFRENVDAIDAVTIIRLMESSWGFGYLLAPVDILKQEVPIGPNEADAKQILRTLNLELLESKVLNDLKKFYINICSEIVPSTNAINNIGKKRLHEEIIFNTNKTIQSKASFDINSLENRFGFHSNVKKIRRSNEQQISGKIKKSIGKFVDFPEDLTYDIDNIENFDDKIRKNHPKTHTVTKNTLKQKSNNECLNTNSWNESTPSTSENYLKNKLNFYNNEKNNCFRSGKSIESAKKVDCCEQNTKVIPLEGAEEKQSKFVGNSTKFDHIENFDFNDIDFELADNRNTQIHRNSSEEYEYANKKNKFSDNKISESYQFKSCNKNETIKNTMEREYSKQNKYENLYFDDNDLELDIDNLHDNRKECSSKFTVINNDVDNVITKNIPDVQTKINIDWHASTSQMHSFPIKSHTDLDKFANLDFDDADLEFNCDIHSDRNIKTALTSNELASNKELKYNIFREESLISEQQNSSSLNTTLAKLMKFQNPKVCEKSKAITHSSPNLDKIINSLNHTVNKNNIRSHQDNSFDKNKKLDDIECGSQDTFKKSTISSSSHVLAEQNDDLDCLDFDL